MKADDFSVHKGVDAESAYIEVTFTDLPKDIVLDSTFQTTFEDERLTDKNGNLVVRHTFTYSSKTKSLRAMHPVLVDTQKPLLSLNATELKTLAKEHEVDLPDIDKRANALIRMRLRGLKKLFTDKENLCLGEDIAEVKAFFGKIEKNYPLYFLFRAENVSDENEKFIQDPVKIIVSSVLERYSESLINIAQQVNAELTRSLGAVADELASLAPSLSTKFSPHNIEANWPKAYSNLAFHD